MSVMVTGGAGYIGAHIVRLLQERGDRVVVLDDLSSGDAGRIGDAAIEPIDLAAHDAVDAIAAAIARHDVEAVFHLAAKKKVPESVEQPIRYYRENVGGTANLLEAMGRAGVERLVFSSTAAVYGEQAAPLVTERSAVHPINPYGESKLVSEWLIADVARATPLRATSLRYFNVAGAGWPDLGDRAVANLLTIVLDRIERGLTPQVYGTGFDTADGTGVRDYVHVLDLAQAHLVALDRLHAVPPGHTVYNVGRGVGTSVIEILDEVSAALGRPVPAEVVAARAGDPAHVVADVTRIADELGWRAGLGLDQIVTSAVAARAGAA
ncbi:UDP-glucose 4-epimerase GalE [Agromyces sp. NPDC057679]|uniref:UDP-glucose 4-epimerase GalE n=1 Tax=Agromyces sp. NPDC057679 TaxID=3346207 RepID=UPI00366F5EFE